jgi:hypothetical protein
LFHREHCVVNCASVACVQNEYRLGDRTPVQDDDDDAVPPARPRVPPADTAFDLLGARLRRLYDDALDEEIPDPFKDLLDKLR